MAMLGDWNWYLPSWLRWLPDLRVEGGPGEPVPVPVTVGISDTAVRSRDDS